MASSTGGATFGSEGDMVRQHRRRKVGIKRKYTYGQTVYLVAVLVKTLVYDPQTGELEYSGTLWHKNGVGKVCSTKIEDFILSDTCPPGRIGLFAKRHLDENNRVHFTWGCELPYPLLAP